MDKVRINRLKVNCIIGDLPEERQISQDIFITMTVGCDCAPAGHSDDLNDAVDYFQLAKDAAQLAIDGKFKLLETLAENLASLCLERDKVLEVTVKIEKPLAIPGAQSAEIEIYRVRQ